MWLEEQVIFFGVRTIYLIIRLRFLSPYYHAMVDWYIGDIAFRFLDRLKHSVRDPGTAHVNIVDINASMLDIGRRRAKQFDYEKG
jgi:hypothetical protein